MGKPILDQVRQTASPAEREERLKKARREVLDHLIDSKLLEEEMKKKKIEVPDRDVDAAIQDILKSSNLTEDGLKKALARGTRPGLLRPWTRTSAGGRSRSGPR